MSMPRAVRHINEIRILDALFRKGPMSRADLGRELGLMRSTAGNLVAGLAREGLVAEGRSGPTGRVLRTGRPGSYVGLNAGHSTFLGADIGVGRITVVALNLEAVVVARAETDFDTDHADPASVADAVATAIGRVSGTLPDPTTVRGLSVAVAGLLDRDGIVMRAPMLRWSGVPLLAMLRDRLPDLPEIAAENDANAFAMAELHRPDGAVGRHAVFVFLDAGVGGGLVHDGHLVRGCRGYAGEIGHVRVGEDGFSPAKTTPGSLESFVGRDAVLRRHRFHGGSSSSLDEVAAAAARGEDAARRTVSEWAEYLGRGLATLTTVLDPETIVLGGPVAVLFRFVEREVAAALRANLLPNHPVPDVRISTLGVDAPAIGAASMLHKAMLSFDTDLVFHGRAP